VHMRLSQLRLSQADGHHDSAAHTHLLSVPEPPRVKEEGEGEGEEDMVADIPSFSVSEKWGSNSQRSLLTPAARGGSPDHPTDRVDAVVGPEQVLRAISQTGGAHVPISNGSGACRDGQAAEELAGAVGHAVAAREGLEGETAVSAGRYPTRHGVSWYPTRHGVSCGVVSL
jgi:hypothetical protein